LKTILSIVVATENRYYHYYLPLIFAIITAYGLSLIPNLFIESRILTLAWIGISNIKTLIVLTLVFIPLHSIKQLLQKNKPGQ